MVGFVAVRPQVEQVSVLAPSGSEESWGGKGERVNNALDLSKRVDHQRDELHTSVSRDLALCLEPSEEECEELGDEPAGGTVFVFFVVRVVFVTLVGALLTLLEVCEGRGRGVRDRSVVKDGYERREEGREDRERNQEETHQTRRRTLRNPLQT